MVAGINYIPAEAKALPHEGASALVICLCFLQYDPQGWLNSSHVAFRAEHALSSHLYLCA
jgi:hypothetical protein